MFVDQRIAIFAVGDKQFDLLVFYTQDRCKRDLGDSLRRFET